MSPTRFSMSRTLAGLACTATLAVAHAQAGWAADLNGAPPIAQEEWAGPGLPSIWQGFYLGLSAGYGFGDSTHFYDRGGNHGTASTQPSGFMGSATAGYNWRTGPSMVFGVEGDLGLMNVSAEDKVVFDGHIYKTNLGPMWGTVRARLGMLLSERALVYATGGGAMMQVDEVVVGNTPGETATNSSTRSGWVLGVGAEYAFTQSTSLKAEYLYMDFGRYSGYSANREDYYFDNQVQLVRAGLNFKF
ncbi:MAG: porin family protein [Hyphomicrobiaceae bacterium]